MYCELGGDVCGEIWCLGHKREVVCIVSEEGEYVRRSMRLGFENEAVGMGCMWGDWGWVAENKGVCVVSGMRIWGDQRWLGHEKEAVCIVRWEGMYVGRSGAWDTRKRLYVL